MSRILYLFDVSPFIHTGENVPTFGQARIRQFPVRGANYLLKYLVSTIKTHSDIILCFDSASFRKSIDENYKAKRSHNVNVTAQLEMLYSYLPRYGVTCLKQEGAEADDLIFTCVEKYKHMYEKIVIYTVDYDIAHNVCSNVVCHSINSQSLDVTPSSFEAVTHVPYNTIAASKVFLGDKSDNIPSFGSDARDLFRAYLKVRDQIEAPFDVLKSEDFLNLVIDNVFANQLNQDRLAELRKRVELIFPKVIEFSYDFEPCCYGTIDVFGLAKFANTLGNTVAVQALNIPCNDRDQGLLDYLQDTGVEIGKGYYAIDKCIVEKCEKMDFNGSIMVRDF